MSSLIPFIILGLASGSVYGMAGVGLVLTYKTSGIFNFAFGAVGTLAAYIFYTLNVSHGVPWPVAAVVVTVVLGVALGLISELLARRLSKVALAVQIVAVIGVVLAIEALLEIIYGGTDRTFPVFLPQSTVEIFGAYVSWGKLIVVGFTLLVTGLLYAMLKFTTIGIAMRAVVDDPDLLDVSGTKPRRVRRSAWIIGTLFSVMAGILLAQSTSLDPVTLTSLVAQSYAAAAIGAFSSLPLTYAGGLGVGVLASILTKYIPQTEIISGIPVSLPFIILFLVLVLMPKRRLAGRVEARPLTSAARVPALRVQGLFGVIAVAAAALVPLVAGSLYITGWTTVLPAVIMFLSVGLLVKTSGQVSLAQVGFAAIGAVAFSKLTVEAHIPWLLALIVAGLVVVPIGALIAVPAIRLSGIYLALATFGFGLLLQNMFYNSSWMFGSFGQGITLPQPVIPGIGATTANEFYYVVLIITVVVAVSVVALTRSRLGRLLRALGDSPTALRTSGTSTLVTQILVFCISAFLAGISGALLGATIGDQASTSFDPTLSLTYLALVLITVGPVPWYAVLAAAASVLIPLYVTLSTIASWMQLAFGVAAILMAIQPQVQTPAWAARFVDRLAVLLRDPSVRPVRRAEEPGDEAAARRSRRAPVGAAAGLDVSDVSVRFGGLTAVSDLGLSVPSGKITGLIGPNGAGKTTTFNAICGLNRPASSRIVVNGNDVTTASVVQRSLAGLGRTFQQMQLYDSLSVLENVRLGAEASLAGRNPLRHLLSRRGDKAAVDATALDAMRLCGIEYLAQRKALSLSTGQRRLVELARCLASPANILLLDEPSSGLDSRETNQLGEILLRVVRERETAILLVEHDMSLVMRVCSDITVLDFGRVIFSGSATEVASSPVVQAAYLGSVEVMAADPSGAESLEPGMATE